MDGRSCAVQLAIFYGVAFAATTAVTIAVWSLPADFRTGDVDAVRRAVHHVGMFAVFVPVLTAILCTAAMQGWRTIPSLLSRILILRVPLRYYAIALLVPPLTHWIGTFLWSRATGVELDYPAVGGLLSYWAQASVFGALVLLGEEIGWRGFMLPRLLDLFGWRSAALIAGMLWTGWHLPIWIPANLAATGSASQTALILTFGSLGAVSLSVVMTWLFIRTRYSIAIAALLHGSSNASMNRVYDTLGDGAASASWVICYNLLLVLVAAALLLLPDSGEPLADLMHH